MYLLNFMMSECRAFLNCASSEVTKPAYSCSICNWQQGNKNRNKISRKKN